MTPAVTATATASTRKVTCRPTPMAAVAAGPKGRTSQRSTSPTTSSRALATIRGQVSLQMRRNNGRLSGSNNGEFSAGRVGSDGAGRKKLYSPPSLLTLWKRRPREGRAPVEDTHEE